MGQRSNPMRSVRQSRDWVWSEKEREEERERQREEGGGDSKAHTSMVVT